MQSTNRLAARLPRLFLLSLVLVGILLPARPINAATPTASWRDSGLPLTTAPACFDESDPATLIATEPDGSAAYNWQTGQRRPISRYPLSLCGPNGLIFTYDAAAGQSYRSSLDQPAPLRLEHGPTHAARDGSSQVYSLEDGQLWSSPDGGLGWQPRSQPQNMPISSLAVAPADAQVLYASTIQRQPTRYTLYRSADGGRSWERRFQRESAHISGVQVEGLAGAISPVDMLVLIEFTSENHPQRSVSARRALVSIDGARSFNEVYSRIDSGLGPIGLRQADRLAYTSEGLTQLIYSAYSLGGQQHLTFELRVSSDGGVTWGGFMLPQPAAPAEHLVLPQLLVSPAAPASLVLQDYSGGLWYSSNNGRQWRPLGSGQPLLSPYLPLTLARWEHGGLQTQELAVEGWYQLRPAVELQLAGGSYFSLTGHNLSGPLKAYWERHGGLAQFGYPKTEPLRELNPSDGRIYLVQYFERNRLEYHPELAGTQYEVLLGLLGNQMTADRRAAGEQPFMPVTTTRFPDQVLFPETGHTLRGAFRRYWEQNGGLAIYGYPISEEFEERNPDDGKIYIVQYFERARFEWHPENKATRYEVLLGLLGTQLLRDKGWE